jgi:hypothetical protein
MPCSWRAGAVWWKNEIVVTRHRKKSRGVFSPADLDCRIRRPEPIIPVFHHSNCEQSELADNRINVTVIAPGLIDTDMTRKRGIDRQRHFVAWPRIGKPEDVAGAAAFSLSDEAEFITGQVLSPNGGAYI